MHCLFTFADIDLFMSPKHPFKNPTHPALIHQAKAEAAAEVDAVLAEEDNIDTEEVDEEEYTEEKRKRLKKVKSKADGGKARSEAGAKKEKKQDMVNDKDKGKKNVPKDTSGSKSNDKLQTSEQPPKKIKGREGESSSALKKEKRAMKAAMPAVSSKLSEDVKKELLQNETRTQRAARLTRLVQQCMEKNELEKGLKTIEKLDKMNLTLAEMQDSRAAEVQHICNPHSVSNAEPS